MKKVLGSTKIILCIMMIMRLCIDQIRKGYLNYYCPTAIAYHDTFTGSKIKYSNKRWLYYSVRNSILFMKKKLQKRLFKSFLYNIITLNL